MLKQTKRSGYNDGVVAFYKDTTATSTFAARQNPKSIDDLGPFIVKLAYTQVSAREKDQEFAEAHGFAIDLKCKARKVNGVDSACKAVVGGRLYDVAYVDPSATELYFYLQEVCEL